MRPTFFWHFWHGAIVVYYFALYFLNQCGCENADILIVLVNHLTEPKLATLEHLVPERLGAREDTRKPFAITGHLDDVKLLWCIRSQKTRRSVLDEVARLEIEHLEEQLNLRKIVLGALVLNLARQWTLDFDKTPRFCNTVGRSAEPLMHGVLDQTNFVRFLVIRSVIQVSCNGLEQRAMLGGGISLPAIVVTALLDDEVARLLVGIITDGGCKIARCEHRSTEGMPFRRSLIIVALLKELLDPWVDLIHI